MGDDGICKCKWNAFLATVGRQLSKVEPQNNNKNLGQTWILMVNATIIPRLLLEWIFTNGNINRTFLFIHSNVDFALVFSRIEMYGSMFWLIIECKWIRNFKNYRQYIRESIEYYYYNKHIYVVCKLCI